MNVFNQVSTTGDWRKIRIRDRPNISISVNDSGSHIETDLLIPVIKVELLFDPKFNMSKVIYAI